MNSEIKKEALLVFLVLGFFFAYFYHDPYWNGNSRLGLSLAIVQEGRLEIDSFHDAGGFSTGDKAFHNGHYYTDKAIGSSIAAAIVYFPIYHFLQALGISIGADELKYLLTLFSIGLPSAVSGTLMYILCRQVSGNRLRSYAAAIATCLGTMIFPYSITFFGHQLAGSTLFGAFFLIYQLKLSPRPPQMWVLFLTGFLLGFALITEYTIAPIALILAVYYLSTIFRKGWARSAAAYLLPAAGGLIPIAILLAYNTLVFGSPFSLGYSFMSDSFFQKAHSQGIIGVSWPNLKVMFYLTLHPAMGLFWQSPFLLFSLAGIWLMSRLPDIRAEAYVALGAFLSLLLINSGHYMWWGGETFGPRHLIPMLPFLCLPLVFIPGRWFYGVVILGVISILQMVIVAACRFNFAPERFYMELDQTGYFAYSSIYNFCLPQLLRNDFSPTFGSRVLGLNNWASLLPPLMILFVVSLVFVFGLNSIKTAQSRKKLSSIRR